jgi:hypothetical protein
MDALFPFTSPNSRVGRKATMDLFADRTSFRSTYPLFVADIDVSAIQTQDDFESTCCDARCWDVQDWDVAENIIQCPIIFPFADAFCVFTDDFATNAKEGLINAIKDFEDLSFYAEDTDPPSFILPHVYFITSAPFSEKTTQSLRNSRCIRSSETISLGAEIAQELSRKREVRKNACYRFSARHLPWFLDQAIQHVT